MGRTTLFLLCMFILFGTASYASDVDKLVTLIEDRSRTIQDIQGRFIQKSYIKDLDRTESYKGEFFISRRSGTKMKWIYEKPRDEEVIITGTDIWIYKRSEKQALKSRFSEGSYGQTPIALLSSLQNLRNNFDITMAGHRVLRLLPKRPMGAVKKVLLRVDDNNFPITGFTFIDAYDNRIDIEITDVRINPGLKDSIFVFKAPPGVEVFDFNP